MAAKLTLKLVHGALCLGVQVARAQGTAFTYQGRLNDGGDPSFFTTACRPTKSNPCI